MTLGEFLEKFSSNNLIRLHYICDVSGGYKTVLEEFNKVSMDWEVNKNKGPYKNYKDNEVIKLASILWWSLSRSHKYSYRRNTY